MNMEQFVADIIELTQYLQDRFRKRKVTLVGHSWGSAIGVLAVQRRPDLFNAYIGIGQRGESNGCHRMHNYVVLRLASFLVKHRENVRDGLVPEDYVRHLEYKGQEVALASESKGYRFKLTPPVPVTVLHGDVRGNARATKSVVPLNVAP
jgi:pimeloyl-ACP methyl ester carboxylesterase